MRYDVAALGETMLRLSVPVGERLSGTAGFDAHVGGAESNVLAALATLERRCGFVTAVPDSTLGDRVVADLRRAGIDTTHVVRAAGTRLGLYFLEPGVPPRAGDVIYDRKRSAAAALRADEVVWEALLDTRLIHLTGITPAVGADGDALAARLLTLARERGVPVAFDVNFRSKLWAPVDAAAWIDEHAAGLDVLICGRGDAKVVFGLEGTDEQVLGRLAERLGARTTVLTRGEDGAIAFASGALVEAPSHAAVVVDPIGAGDAFAAGVIDGWLDGDVGAGLRRGVAMGGLALAQRGDMLATSRAEVEAIVRTVPSGGRVQR